MASGTNRSSQQGYRTMGNDKPTIVLVHGAWADASSWSRVIGPLVREGFTVTAPPNNLRGLGADAAYVRAYLETVPGPIVLVAHSYGGMVITNAATGLPNVKALVYVDAFIPDEGQPAVALTGAESALASAATDPQSLFKLAPYPGAPEGSVDTYLLAATVADSFAQDLTPDEQALITATQRPGALAGLAEAFRATRVEGHPRLGRRRYAGPDHHARLAAPDGGARERPDHRGGCVPRVDGLAPRCHRRRDPDGGRSGP